MKYLSLFSGIGGFELGIQKAYENIRDNRKQEPNDEGVRSERDKSYREGGAWNEREQDHDNTICVGYSEIDRYASSIYQRQFPTHKNYGDITKINEGELPDFDMLVGGFPCQSFSIAGQRRGFDDTRGTLFFDIARILKAKKPKLALLENVKGLLSHDDGRTFKTIIATLDELGYDVQWQVLNSKDFGVPQNRERVYIVGHLRGTARPEVFPFAEDGGSPDELSRHVSNTLTARYEGGQATGSYIGEGKLDAQEINQLNDPIHSNDRVYGSNGISPTLNMMHGGNRQPFIRIENMNGDGFENPYSGTIRAGASKSTNIVNNVRRLTPMECERLQGFPDNWTAEGTEGPISDTQRYKCCGNAVTTNVIQAVMERLLD